MLELSSSLIDVFPKGVELSCSIEFFRLDVSPSFLLLKVLVALWGVVLAGRWLLCSGFDRL
jgi:hypothetical protein